MCVMLMGRLMAQSIPDHKAQSPSNGIAFFAQEGQIAGTDHVPLADAEFASSGHPVQLVLREHVIMSYVLRITHADTSVQDTTLRIDVQPIGELADPNVVPQGVEQTNYYHNYYLPQCPDGVTGLYGHRRLVYSGIYPNIDMHVYSNAWGYKIYYVVHPGGDPALIRLKFTGQDYLEPDILGGLRAITQDRWIRIPQAIAYQVVGNSTVAVPWTVEYEEVSEDLTVGLTTDVYDTTKVLIFDISEDTPLGGAPPLPSVEWGTYYNGLDAHVLNAARTTDGGFVSCGASASEDFPLTNGVTTPPNGGQDAFYSRFTDQYHMLYTSYIGGIDGDQAMGVAELNGRVVVTGTTKDAGEMGFQAPAGGFKDDTEGIEQGNNLGTATGTCWLAAFTADGIREWMTLFGPYYALEPANVDFDDAGNIYLAGTVHWLANYGALPVSATDQPTYNSLSVWGAGYSQNQMGYIYYTPGPPEWTDGFYAKFTSGYQLEHSTLFGGSSYYDHIVDMEVLRSDGIMFITGSTMSPQGSNPLCTQPGANAPGFPWCPGANPDPFFMSNTPPGVHYDGEMTAWLAQIKSTGDLMYCSSLACRDMPDEAVAVSVSNGRVVVVGYHSCETYAPEGCGAPATGLSLCTGGPTFSWPITPNSNDQHYFIQQIRFVTHSLTWSTSIGSGPVNDVSIGYEGKVYVAGEMSSYGDIPLQEHPDYYSSVLPGTGEDQYVLGFDFGGFIWGTRHGAQENTFAAASRTLDRIYVAGNKFNNGFVPYNCPNTVEPWCVEEAALGSITYSQLQVSLPVGMDAQVGGLDHEGVIYPNPTVGELSLQLDGNWHGAVGLTVVDVAGRWIWSGSTVMVNGRSTIGDLRLAPGTYSMQVRASDGSQQSMRFIVSSTN